MLSDLKQSVVFLQQLKLILIFNHEQKEFKANDIKHIKKIFFYPWERAIKHKLRTNKGKSYPYVNSSMSHVLYDQEASFHYWGPLDRRITLIQLQWLSFSSKNLITWLSPSHFFRIPAQAWVQATRFGPFTNVGPIDFFFSFGTSHPFGIHFM